MGSAVSGSDQPAPLAGVKVLEFTSIGPGPHCAMLLADLGAEVVRIDRPGGNGWPNPIVDRGRAALVLDLHSEAGRGVCCAAADQADVLIEGMRPGVMERLGLGPEVLCTRNARLVYGRMTGWGQDGPWAHKAGHDLNYIALTGALAAMGEPGRAPSPPLNLVGDFGGGSLYLAVGILAALFERERSGRGQVVDAAIVDGVNSLMSFFAGLLPGKYLSMDRARNPLAGGAPNYRCYECADGRYLSVGALEPRFYESLLRAVGARPGLLQELGDAANWPRQCEELATLFRSRTQAAWCELLEGVDACTAPVLELEQAPDHAHLRGRQGFVHHQGLRQAAPAPRLSRTPARIGPTRDGWDVLAGWGVSFPA
ncbi:MAG: CoA transferase [Proteobacteria bacterium]|nr:CoA transferase [Pseudomonadota bacterium]